MRFGRKLALALEAEVVSGRPFRYFIAHKELKQILSNISKTRKEGSDERDVCVFVREFIQIISNDIDNVDNCLVEQIQTIVPEVNRLLEDTRNLGIGDDGALERLVQALRKV
jgi:hypothetical protein